MCLVSHHRPLHSAGVARTSVLQQIGGHDETLRFWECEEVTFRLAKAGPARAPHRRTYRFICGASIATGLTPRREGCALPDHAGRAELDRADVEGSRPQILRRARSFRGRPQGHPLLQRRLGADAVPRRPRGVRKYVAMARQLDPNLTPAYPKLISMVSRHIGYERAEAIAYLGRAPKAFVAPAPARHCARRPRYPRFAGTQGPGPKRTPRALREGVLSSSAARRRTNSYEMNPAGSSKADSIKRAQGRALPLRSIRSGAAPLCFDASGASGWATRTGRCSVSGEQCLRCQSSRITCCISRSSANTRCSRSSCLVAF